MLDQEQEAKAVEQQQEETKDSYLYYHNDSVAEYRRQRLSPYDSTAQAYFGNTYLGNSEEVRNTFWNQIDAPRRAFLRGTINIPFEIQKAGVLYRSFVYDTTYRVMQNNGGSDRDKQFTGAIENLLAEGKITTEQADQFYKQYEQDKQEAALMQTEQFNREKAETQALLKHVDDHSRAVAKKLRAERTEQEWQWVADLFESAPNTLAGVGVMALVGSPVVAGAVIAATAGAPVLSGVGEQVLEQGGSIQQAFGLGLGAAAPSVALEFAGDYVLSSLWKAPVAKEATKKVLKSRLLDWAAGRTASGALEKGASIGLRSAAVGAMGEGFEEVSQGLVEDIIPRAFGFGKDFDSMYEYLSDLFYQGFIGAISGGLFGGGGAFISSARFHRTVKNAALEAGESEQSATGFADRITEVFAQKGEEARTIVKQEMQKLNGSPESVDSTIKILETLFGALGADERSQIESRFKKQLDAANPEGAENGENAVGASVLFATAQLAAATTGANINEVADGYTAEMRDDMNPTDKKETLHARDKEGRIIGSAQNGPGKKILTLLKGGDPVAVVHEASHLLMNAVAEAYARYGNDPTRVNPLVLDIVGRYGEPASKEVPGYFSEEQQEQFASDVTRAVLEGDVVSPSLAVAAARINQGLHSIDNSMSKAGVHDKQTKKTFAKIFANSEAKTPNKIPIKERIAELRKTIKDINEGKTPSIKDLRQLAEWIAFGRGAKPYTTEYTLEDFISEHPEYLEQTPAGKIEMLQQFGFDLSSFMEGLSRLPGNVEENLEQTSALIDSQADKIVLSEEVATKRTAEKDARFNEALQVYKELFAGVNVEQLTKSIQALRQKGFVVIDQKQVQDAVGKVEALIAEAEALQKKIDKAEQTVEVATARKALDRVVRLANTVARNLEMTDVDTKGLNSALDKAKQVRGTQSAQDILNVTNDVLERLRADVDSMAVKYYGSETFLEQQGVIPPAVDKNVLGVQVATALVRAGRKTTASETYNTARLMTEVRKVLTRNKVPPVVADNIIAELSQYNFQELTGPNSFVIAQTIMDKISMAYQKKMSQKIRDQWKELMKAHNKNKINPKDRMAIEWMDKNIMHGKKKSTDLATLNFDEPIGKDAEGNDVYLTFEQKELASALRAVKTRAYKDPADAVPGEVVDTFAVGNQQLADTYIMLYMVSQTTRDFPSQFAAKEKIRIADMTAEAMNTVKKRKALPKALQTIENWFISGPLGGLYSNLTAYFGDQFAKDTGLLVAQRKQEKFRSDIFRDIRNAIAIATKQNSDIYLAHLRTDKPFAHKVPGVPEEIRELLKDYKRGEILNIWLISRDADGLETLQTVFGSKTKDVIAAIQNRPTFLIDRAMGLMMSQYINNLYGPVSDTYLRINGVPMGQVENYWPHEVLRKSDGVMITDMNGMFVPNPKIKGDPRYTKSRVGLGNAKLVISDAYTVFTNYVNNASSYIHTTEKLNDLSRVMHNEDLKNLVVEKYGKHAYDAVLGDITYNMNIADDTKTSYLSKLFNEMITNKVVATLGIKFWSALKQVPSFINFAANMPAGAFMRYAPYVITHAKENWNYMLETYPQLRSRYTDSFPAIWATNASMYQEGISALFGDGAVKDSTTKKLALAAGINAKAREWLMKPIRVGDMTAVTIGARILEMHLKEQMAEDPQFRGWTEQEKHDYIEDRLVEATETTQQSGLNVTRGGWQHSDSALARSLLAFTSQNAQYVRKLREATHAYVNGEMSLNEFIKNILIYGVIDPGIYVMMSSPALYIALATGLFGGDDDDYKEELYLSAVRPFVDNVFSAWGTAGGVVTLVADAMAQKAGQKTYGLDGGVIDPFLIKDIERAAKTFAKDEVSGEEYFDSASNMVELGVPLPLQTMKKMVKGSWNLMTKDDVGFSRIFYLGQMMGMSERQVQRAIEEIED